MSKNIQRSTFNVPGASFGARLCPKDQPQPVVIRTALGLATLLRLVCDTAALRSLRGTEGFYSAHWALTVEC